MKSPRSVGRQRLVAKEADERGNFFAKRQIGTFLMRLVTDAGERSQWQRDWKLERLRSKVGTWVHPNSSLKPQCHTSGAEVVRPGQTVSKQNPHQQTGEQSTCDVSSSSAASQRLWDGWTCLPVLGFLFGCSPCASLASLLLPSTHIS